MALLARKKIILAKLEASYGTDANPTGAEAVETSNFSITPLAGPQVGRNLDRPVLGNDLQIQVGTFVQCQFEVQIAGAGAPEEAPQWGSLLRACGFSETITPTTGPVVYDLVSAAFESMTIYAHLDGQLHKLLGARGSVAFNVSPGGIPAMTFNFTGLYDTPASTADPVPDFTGWQVPLPGNNRNTTVFELHGTTPTMEALTIDIANEVPYRNVVGNESVQISDRAPAGSVTIEKQPISEKDWYTAAKQSQTGALKVVHGTTAGNIVTIDAPEVQVFSPTDGESDGIATVQMNLALIPSDTGDDEIQITTS